MANLTGVAALTILSKQFGYSQNCAYFPNINYFLFFPSSISHCQLSTTECRFRDDDERSLRIRMTCSSRPCWHSVQLLSELPNNSAIILSRRFMNDSSSSSYGIKGTFIVRLSCEPPALVSSPKSRRRNAKCPTAFFCVCAFKKLWHGNQ